MPVFVLNSQSHNMAHVIHKKLYGREKLFQFFQNSQLWDHPKMMLFWDEQGKDTKFPILSRLKTQQINQNLMTNFVSVFP